MVCFSYTAASNKTQHRSWEGEKLEQSGGYTVRTNDLVSIVFVCHSIQYLNFGVEEV